MCVLYACVLKVRVGFEVTFDSFMPVLTGLHDLYMSLCVLHKFL